jgi:hypothetical protein
MSLAVILVLTANANSQYRDEPPYRQPEARFVSLGFLQRTFRPLGSNPLADSLAISYDRFMPVIGLRQGLLDILLGYTRYRMQGASRETILLVATARQEFPLTRGSAGALVVPVALSTDFTKAQTTGSLRENFGVASIGAGSGLKVRSAGRGYDASIEVLGLAHYSFDGLGTGSGFSPALTAEASILLPDALSFAGLVGGYRLRIQSWRMSEDKFDYTSVSHGAYVGIGF